MATTPADSPSTGRLTPAERSLLARAAANTRWASEPGRVAATRPARDGVRRRYERQVDPDNELDPAERARRADSALRAHMQRLAARSSIARRSRSAKP